MANNNKQKKYKNNKALLFFLFRIIRHTVVIKLICKKICLLFPHITKNLVLLYRESYYAQLKDKNNRISETDYKYWSAEITSIYKKIKS